MQVTKPSVMFVILLLAGVTVATMAQTSRLNETYAWKTVDFVFPNKDVRAAVIRSGQFLAHRTMPMGFEIWKNKLFITIPRRKAGVPVVLGYVNLNDTSRSPLVIPFPNYFTNTLPGRGNPKNAVHITTAYRIRADPCDRLWIIDTGRADVGKGFIQISTPKILVYNLHNDQLILKYDLKNTDYKPDSFFANIAVDVTNSTCDNAYAYMPDLGAYGLVVFSLKAKDSWRVKHNYFYFDPLAGDFNIDGLNFQLTDGAFSVALSHINQEGYRTLYFHSLSSYNEFSVSTKILQNKTIASNSFREFKNLGQRGKSSQSSATFFDEKTGVLFFLEVQNHAVTCWNTLRYANMPGNIDIIATDKNSRAFIYPSDIKVDRNANLWVLTNNIPGYIFRDLDPNVYNYFIFKSSVKNAIQGTKCDSSEPQSAVASGTSDTSIYFASYSSI